MNVNIACLLLTGLLVPVVASSEALQTSPNTRIETVASLSTKELWSLTKPEVIEIGSIIVDARMFDPEEGFMDGKWRGCGVVMIGTSDLGTQPMVFRIWTQRSCDLSITKASPDALHLATFAVHVGLGEKLNIAIAENLSVAVNGKHAGKIEVP